jgi:hypothetical protein
MDKVGFEAIAVLLVLLPGFLAARTVQSLCVRPTQTELDKVVEALLYSFLIYVAFVVCVGRIPLAVVQESLPDGVNIYRPAIRPQDLLVLLLLGLGLGIIVSASVTNDWYGRAFRRIHATQKTTRSSIWSDVFHDLSYYVQIQFCDGRKIIGWPRYFSDTPEEATLFLENAAWVDKDGKQEDIPGPGILITKNMPIETIMFLSGERILQDQHS